MADDSINNNGDGALSNDGGKRCNIFVLDYGEHVDSGSFSIALKALRDRINNACVTGDQSELAAVIFMNTVNSNKEAEQIDRVFVHRPIGAMDAEYVKQLDELLASGDPKAELAEVLGGSGTCNLGELFFLVSRMLTYATTIIRKKSVLLFTVDHDPTEGDAGLLKNIRSRIKDLQGKDVQLFPFLLGCKEGDAISDFWGRVGLGENVSCAASLDELQKEVKRKNFALRAAASIPFKLGGGLDFAVGVYSLVREQSKPLSCWLNSETNEAVEGRTHYVTNRGGDGDGDVKEEDVKMEADANTYTDFDGEIGFAQGVGEVKVVLSKKEYDALRRLDSPSITVIGFKPLHLLKASHRMGPSAFVFPLENIITGSSTLYRALYQRCLERQLFILVCYTQRSNTMPQLGALIPQSKKGDGDEDAVEDQRYEGFHFIELPFAEDKRDLQDRMAPPEEEGTWPEATPAQIGAANAFTKKLTTAFTPFQYCNPTLQRFYSGVETMALDLDAEQFLREAEGLDQIKPYFENEKLKQRVHKELNEFAASCGVGAEKAANLDDKKKRLRSAAGAKKGAAALKEDEAEAPETKPSAATAKRGRKKAN